MCAFVWQCLTRCICVSSVFCKRFFSSHSAFNEQLLMKCKFKHDPPLVTQVYVVIGNEEKDAYLATHANSDMTLACGLSIFAIVG